MGGMNGNQIYDNFTAGQPEVFQSWGDSVKQLSDSYGDEAKAIADLQNRMNQYWTGPSGEAASSGAGPLAAAYRDSSIPLDQTTKLMEVQSSALGDAKSTVVPVPPQPEKPSGWSLGLKAAIPVAGPFMAANDWDSYQDGVAAHNAANETNVRVMDQYSNTTTSSQSAMPMSYQPLSPDMASVKVSPPELSVNGGVAPSTGTLEPLGNTVDAGGSVRSAPNLTGPVTTGGKPNLSGPVTTGSNLPRGPIGSTPPGTSTRVPGGGEPIVAGGTTDPSGERTGRGKTPAGGSKSPVGRGNAADRLFNDSQKTSGKGGSGRTGSGGGAGASEDERLRRGGNSANERLTGRGGSGSAAGESASRGVGAGKSSGAGPGNAAAAEEAAASRAGRGGARGANGTPMGAAGQRGEGSEDEEHQRPDYLIEPDPDDIFGTDARTAPPVIGE